MTVAIPAADTAFAGDAVADGVGLGSALAERRERSWAALSARYPRVAARLSGAALSRPVVEQGEVADIDLGPRRLYDGDGRAIARQQSEEYLADPLRFFVVDLGGTNIGSPVSQRLNDHLLDECRRLGLETEDLDVKPNYDGSLLVVLGVGLGFHLRALIERIRPRHVILAEPHPDFLHHALAAFDWAEFFGWLDERECKLTWTLSDDPDTIIRDIQAMFNAEGTPFIDGAYVFLHYPAWALTEARKRLERLVNTTFLSRGFYEDELVMMTNAMTNLAQRRFRLVDLSLKPARPEPVFIIGSGPSIDQSIEHVKRLRDRAIVFSCGTGLRVCLRHGIVPDFHSDLENGAWVIDTLSASADPETLRGISLVGSLTLDPGVTAKFDDQFLFFRDSVSSSQLMASPTETELFGVGPTCANTALRIAVAFGFQEIYLFGLDCGTKSSVKKHSSESLYHTIEKLKNVEKNLILDYTYPGNFGGTVMADWIFNFSRQILASVVQRYRIRVSNCSDGARIDGALPKVPAALNLTSPVLDRAKVKDAIRAVHRCYEPAEFLHDSPFAEWRQAAEQFFDDSLEMIDQAIEHDRNFVEFWRRLSEFFAKAEGAYRKVGSIVSGSAVSMPKIGMFYAHRIRDPEQRQEIFNAFLRHYRATFEFMRDGTFALFDSIERRLESPVEANPVV